MNEDDEHQIVYLLHQVDDERIPHLVGAGAPVPMIGIAIILILLIAYMMFR